MKFRPRFGPAVSEIPSPWFTVTEAARYAKVSPDLTSRWINQGRLFPALTREKRNLAGRGAAGYLIGRDDLDTFLRSLKVNVAAAAGPGEGEAKASRAADQGDLPPAAQARRDLRRDVPGRASDEGEGTVRGWRPLRPPRARKRNGHRTAGRPLAVAVFSLSALSNGATILEKPSSIK
jgi:hypothetical protein